MTKLYRVLILATIQFSVSAMAGIDGSDCGLALTGAPATPISSDAKIEFIRDWRTQTVAIVADDVHIGRLAYRVMKGVPAEPVTKLDRLSMTAGLVVNVQDLGIDIFRAQTNGLEYIFRLAPTRQVLFHEVMETCPKTGRMLVWGQDSKHRIFLVDPERLEIAPIHTFSHSEGQPIPDQKTAGFFGRHGTAYVISSGKIKLHHRGGKVITKKIPRYLQLIHRNSHFLFLSGSSYFANGTPLLVLSPNGWESFDEPISTERYNIPVIRELSEYSFLVTGLANRQPSVVLTLGRIFPRVEIYKD